jgi:ketosteroid isomerase-like protein
MINLFEVAALDAVERLLPAGRQSLGTVLNVRHVAATPVGMRVVATAEVTAFNKSRYKWVKKKFGPTHSVAGGTPEETIVYQTGHLYGEWPDGTPFEGNRYVDRYVVRHGKIVKMEVWNDSAEWLLVRAGLVKP